MLILEGMRSVFNGSGIIDSTAGEASPITAQHHGERKEIVANADGEIEFGYCSEFLIHKDPRSTRDPVRLRAISNPLGIVWLWWMMTRSSKSTSTPMSRAMSSRKL